MLFGGSGNDIIIPGPGLDIMIGGPGNDTFYGTLLELDHDVITDFLPGDQILIVNSILSLANLSVRFGSAILDIDEDLDGVVDSTITLEGDFDPQATTFNVVANSLGNSSITLVPTNLDPTASDDSFTINEDASLVFTPADLLLNDSDPDVGDTLSISSFYTEGLLGSITENVDGTFTFIPDPIVNGLSSGESFDTSFSYTVSDGNGETDIGRVDIEIQGQDDPDAVNDLFEIGKNTTISITADQLTGNDIAIVAGDLDVVDLDLQNTLGQLSLNSQGELEYTPQTDFEGEDFFGYTIQDSNGGADNAAVTVRVSATVVNTDPVAADDGSPDPTGFNTNEDTAFTTANVLTNDTDGDAGDTLSVSAVDNTGTLGLVTDNGNGTFGYNPNGAFESLGVGDSATDSFAYTVSDGNGGSDTATVTVTIQGVNDNPDAIDDVAGTVQGVAVVIDTLSDDTDPENDTLTVASVGAAANGVAVINLDNTITYTPNAGFTGPDNFTYTIEDGKGGSDTASVEVTVTAAPNQAPTVSAITAGFGEDTTGRVVDLLSTANDLDGDDLDIENVVVTTADARVLAAAINLDTGVLTLDDGQFDDLATGVLFDINVAYDVTDGQDSIGNTATITIIGENDAPKASNDGDLDPTGFSTNEDTAFTTANVLTNDTDDDVGDTLSVSGLDTTGTTGLVTNNNDGTFGYNPNGAFESLGVGDSATDSFAYTVSDDNGGSDTATVTVTIQGVNDNPDAIDDTVGTAENTAVVVDVLSDDSDPENDTLTVASVGAAASGTPVINLDNTITYTPNAGFVGDDSFTYTIDDGNGGSDIATVDVTVTSAPNQTPLATPVIAGFSEDDTARTVNLLSTASDPDGDDLDVENVVVTAVDGRVLATLINPETGLLTIGDGQFEDLSTGVPFDIGVTFNVTDGLVSVGNTATITITGANDKPVANDDGNPDPTGFSADEDTSFTTANVLTNDTDIDGDDTLGVSAVDTTGTLGLVVDNGDGTFGYNPSGAFESLGVGDSATDSFAYTVSDGNGGSDTATVTINIASVNDAPVITSANSATIEENTTVVGHLVADDVNAGDALVYSIEGGVDGGVFNFDSAGELSFKAAPDFEAPSDLNGDNIYELSVGVSDGKVLVTQNVTVTVSDVDEGSTSNIIEGTSSSDNLIGTSGKDVLLGRGGAFDFFTGGDGKDIFVFTALSGNGRELGTITDYASGIDLIDLDGNSVSSSFGFGSTTYLFLDGGDFDTLVVNGVGSIAEIDFV